MKSGLELTFPILSERDRTVFPVGQIFSLSMQNYAESSVIAASATFSSCTKYRNGTVRALNTTTAQVNSEE